MKLSMNELDGLFAVYLLREESIDPKRLAESFRDTRELDVPFLIQAETAQLLSKEQLKVLAARFQEELVELHCDRAKINQKWLHEIPAERLWRFVEVLLIPARGPLSRAHASKLPEAIGSPLDRSRAVEYADRVLFAQGGIGQVWKAHEPSTGRQVALKCVKTQFETNDDIMRRFFREGRVTARLEHPAIVPVYRVERQGDHNYYIMRLIEGDTLQEAIDSLHSLSPSSEEWLSRIRMLVTRMVQVCEAAAFAHSHGVIHRDIKPANIILSDYRSVFLVDWGMAKIQSGDEDSTPPVLTQAGLVRPLPGMGTGGSAQPGQYSGSAQPGQYVGSGGSGGSVQPGHDGGFNAADSRPLIPKLADDHTQPGSVLGTPRWMAPEQATGDTNLVDGRTDIFALGAVINAILFNRPPHDLPSGISTERMLAIISRGPKLVPPSHVPAAVRELYAVACKAMETKPQDRYQNAQDLADDLEHWLADEPVSAFQHGRRNQFLRWARHHQALAMTLFSTSFLTVISALMLFVWFNLQHRRVINEFLHSRLTTAFAIVEERVNHQILLAEELAAGLSSKEDLAGRKSILEEYLRFRPFLRSLRLLNNSASEQILCLTAPNHDIDCSSANSITAKQREAMAALPQGKVFADLDTVMINEDSTRELDSANQARLLIAIRVGPDHAIAPDDAAEPVSKRADILVMDFNPRTLFNGIFPSNSELALCLLYFADMKGNVLMVSHGDGTPGELSDITSIQPDLDALKEFLHSPRSEGYLPRMDNRLSWTRKISLTDDSDMEVNFNSPRYFAVVGTAPPHFEGKGLGMLTSNNIPLTQEFPLLIPVITIPPILLISSLLIAWLVRPKRR